MLLSVETEKKKIINYKLFSHNFPSINILSDILRAHIKNMS